MSIEIGPSHFGKDYFTESESNYAYIGGYKTYDSDEYWEPMVQIIEKYGLKGRVLDFGCAYGFLLKRIEPYFEQSVGLDISHFAISQAREQAPESSKYKNLLTVGNEMLPFPKNFFDAIIALEVLEHTLSLENSLRQLRSHLKPRGVLIANMPVSGGWTEKLLSPLDRDMTHISIPTKDELHEAISATGYTILSESYGFDAIIKILGKTFVFRTGLIPSGVRLVLQKDEPS